MKATRMLMATMVLLSGCSTLTPQQQRYVGIGVAVVATGMIIAHRQDQGEPVIGEGQNGKGGAFNPCPSGNSANCK